MLRDLITLGRLKESYCNCSTSSCVSVSFTVSLARLGKCGEYNVLLFIRITLHEWVPHDTLVSLFSTDYK